MSRVRTIYMDDTAVALLRRGLYAAARDERPVLASVLLDRDVAVCTDSYRMTVCYFDGRPLPKALIPVKMLRPVLPKTGDWTATVTDLPVTLNEFGHSLGPDVYPDWRKVLDGCAAPFAYTVDRVALVAALEQLPPRISDGWTIAAVLQPKGLWVSHPQKSWGMGYDRSWDRMKVDVAVDGTAVEPIQVNALLLRELVRATRSETLIFDCDGPHRPVMVREPGLTHLLMPIVPVASAPRGGS